MRFVESRKMTTVLLTAPNNFNVGMQLDIYDQFGSNLVYDI